MAESHLHSYLEYGALIVAIVSPLIWGLVGLAVAYFNTRVGRMERDVVELKAAVVTRSFCAVQHEALRERLDDFKNMVQAELTKLTNGVTGELRQRVAQNERRLDVIDERLKHEHKRD
jgi:cytochrome b